MLMVKAVVEQLLDDLEIEDGASLTPQEKAFVRFGLVTALPCLNTSDIDSAISDAVAVGGTSTQLQEIVSLVSGLGVHSLMVSAPAIARHASIELDSPLTEQQQRLWDERIGDDPFWQGMETELPGFLRAMLLLSADQFEAFFDYCAVPWKSGAVRARVKEMIALATDAMPGHIFMPGLRLHLRNAAKLGVGRVAILECVALAEETPAHAGVP